jgi:hypothetical protein
VAENVHAAVLARLAELRGLAAEVEGALAGNPAALTDHELDPLLNVLKAACDFLRATWRFVQGQG